MALAVNENNNLFEKNTFIPQQIPFKPALDALQQIHLPTLRIKTSIIFPPTLNLHLTVEGLFEQKRGTSICGGRLTIIAGKARVRGNLELESFRLQTGHSLDMKGSQFNLEGKMDLRGKQLLLHRVKGRAGSFNTVSQEQSNFTDLSVQTDFEQKHRFGKAIWSQCLLESEIDNIALGGTDGDLHHVKLIALHGTVGVKTSWVYGDHLRIGAGKRSQIISAGQRLHHSRLVSEGGMLFDGDDITLYETTLKVGTALRVNGEQVHLPALKVLSAEIFKIAAKARIVDLCRANLNVDQLIVRAQEQILLNDLTTRLKEGSIYTEQGWIEGIGLSPVLKRDLKLTAQNGGIYIYDPNISVGNSIKIAGQRVDLRRGDITSKGENEVVGEKGVYSYEVSRKGETVSTEATHGTFYDDGSKNVGKRHKREAQLLVARKVNEVGGQSEWKAATVNACHAYVDSKNGIAIAADSEARVFQSKIVAEDGVISVQAPEQSMRKTIVKAKKLQQAGDKIDGDHMRVVAGKIERVASQMVSSRYAASRIKGDSYQSAPFIDEDHSKVNVKGHDTIDAGNGIVTMADSKRTISSGEVRSGFVDQRGLIETVERGESKVETGILQNDEHTKHRGSGDSIALVDREFVDYSTTISTGLRSITVNEGPYKLAGKVDAHRGILSTPFDLTIGDQYHVSESGSIAGKRFHNLGKVRSEGTLHIKQEQYFPIYDASAKHKLHLTARGDLIPKRAFDAEGDIEFESLEGRTDLLYPVNAGGRGTWRAEKGAVDLHAPVELRDGITVQSETFNAHDILRTGGPNSIDVDWLNLQRAKIRLQGSTDIEARLGAVNSGSEFFILGDTNWRGAAYENFSEMHLEEIVTRSGGGFLGPGLRKWDSKLVLDYLANTQILGHLNVDWNVGTYKNTGLFKCRSMKGYIVSAELEVSSTEGKMPDLPEHEDLMPELPSETINDTQTLEGTDLLVENYSPYAEDLNSNNS